MLRVSVANRKDFLRDECDALRYERSLLELIGGFWRCIEPKGFQSNWHYRGHLDHLEAVADWQIKRGFLINIPPRHMKSLAANVFYTDTTSRVDAGSLGGRKLELSFS